VRLSSWAIEVEVEGQALLQGKAQQVCQAGRALGRDGDVEVRAQALGTRNFQGAQCCPEAMWALGFLCPVQPIQRETDPDIQEKLVRYWSQVGNPKAMDMALKLAMLYALTHRGHTALSDHSGGCL
jgi:hypothetical protein